jgi:hypothetical protein
LKWLASALALALACHSNEPERDGEQRVTPFEDDGSESAVGVSQASTSLTAGRPFAVGVCAYRPSDFSRISRAGIRHVRMDRPSAGLIAYARSFQIEVLPVAVYGYADLSGTNDANDPPLPEHRAEWAKRMVDLWRGMGTPPKRFEVWNEPWNQAFWDGQPDPAAYLELVKAFAAEAWAVWPTASLLVSADSGMSEYPTFRKDLLAADTTGFLNDRRIVPTTHTYVQTRAPSAVSGNPCAYDLRRFECTYQDFKAHGHPDPRIWITEFGWESNTPNPSFSEFGAVTEDEQADYTIGALELFRSSGMVAGAYAFLFRTDANWSYNLLRPDNTDKPVVDRLRQYLATDHDLP